MASRQGETLNERLIRRDASFLRGLGYFSEVHLDACESTPERCRLTVTVVERPAIFMMVPYPVVNYDFEDGLSYGVNWRLKNFRGLGEDLYLSAGYKPDREQGGNFSWNIPWVGGRRVRLRADLYNYRRLDDPVRLDHIERQDVGSIGVGIPLSRSIMRQLWLKSSIAVEWRRSTLFPSGGASPLCDDACRQTFVSAGAELELDSRDDRISPFRGMLGRVRFRRFTVVSGVEQDYIFYSFSSYFYLPVGEGRYFVLAVDGDVREGDVPRFYEMGLGGVRDLRGYDGGAARGTVKLLGTVQWRWRFFGPRVFRIPKIGTVDLTLNNVAFFDTGSLMDSILDLDSRRFHSTAGFGFEIISPLRDLVRLEMAGNGRDKPAFYMTTGTRF